MKVYVAVRGENCEGYGILGIYSTKETAQEKCNIEEKKKYFASCDFTDIEEWKVIE